MSNFWKAYFTGDIHGSEVSFRKFIRAGKFYGVQAMIMAGDLAGKGMVPVLKENGKYICEFSGEVRTAETQADLQKLESMIRDAGFYIYITDRDEVASLRGDEARSAALLDQLVAERTQTWMNMMEESTRKDGVQYYVSPGNDDPFCIDPVLNGSKWVINPEELVVQIHEKIDMMTLGYTNPTPWNTERELPEAELLKKLEALVAKVPDPARCVFSLHAPPYNTKIDLAPRLDANFRMQSGLGQSPFVHVGSTAVRTIIERCQPLVSVHGHIHESAGKDKIGKTECYNPGSEYAQGVLRGVILTFNIQKQAKLANYLSVSG